MSADYQLCSSANQLTQYDPIDPELAESEMNEDNIYVQELKKVFLSCAPPNYSTLDKVGVVSLCHKLQLDRHIEFIVSQILSPPLSESLHIAFPLFKKRFVDLLPKIVEFESKNISNGVNSDFSEACHVPSINEESFVSVDGNSDLNLFHSIDNDDTGIANSSSIVQLWSRSGLLNGQQVLRQLNMDDNNEISLSKLSRILQNVLVDMVGDSMMPKAALISFKIELEHLKSSLIDSQCKSDHYYQEIISANKRRAILIDELENSQRIMEENHEKHLSEIESKNHRQFEQCEEYFKEEKSNLINRLENAESRTRELEENEAILESRILSKDRECVRLRAETADCTRTVGEMERLNRELRRKLDLNGNNLGNNLENKSMLYSAKDGGLWRHKVEVLASQNRRLKDQVDELSSISPSKRSKITHILPHSSTAFRAKLLVIHRRRKVRIEKGTLSEMESDPEPLFYLPRRKRPLCRRQRRINWQKRQERRCSSIDNHSSCSESENNCRPKLSYSNHSAIHQQTDKRVGLASCSKRSDSMLSNENLDRVFKIKEHQWLRSEKEKRDLEIRFASEKNAMERAFAEEKTLLMTRLQTNFEAELKKSRMESSSMESLNRSRNEQLEEMSKKIRMLDSSLEGQRNGYQAKLSQLSTDYQRQINELNLQINSHSNWTIPENLPPRLKDNFYALLDDYKHREERRFDAQREQLLMKMDETRKSIINRCRAKLDENEARLSTLEAECAAMHWLLLVSISPASSSNASVQTDDCYHVPNGAIFNNTTSCTVMPTYSIAIESGVEDLGSGSSADNVHQSVPISEFVLHKTFESVGISSDHACYVELRRLDAIVNLSQARLKETDTLLRRTVEKYRNALKETARLGMLIRRLYSSLRLNIAI